jgi:hypothetical protein
MIPYKLLNIGVMTLQLCVDLFWNIPHFILHMLLHTLYYIKYQRYRTITKIALTRSDRWSVPKMLHAHKLCSKYNINRISYIKHYPIHKSDLLVLCGEAEKHWISVCSCCDEIGRHEWGSKGIDSISE